MTTSEQAYIRRHHAEIARHQAEVESAMYRYKAAPISDDGDPDDAALINRCIAEAQAAFAGWINMIHRRADGIGLVTRCGSTEAMLPDYREYDLGVIVPDENEYRDDLRETAIERCADHIRDMS